ncbi:MAG TPA: aminoglycoside phosphotransferase family protein [Candidatus Dormibacteraeota bacterium]|jgi:aminoglycoside phosphotransferase (APT) family kinase protein|nr:aminoglycoside phosphotransferase family protein [Candidatus Dormibacteraeota bacterium]
MDQSSSPRTEAVNAILIPPALERFRALTGFDESPVEVRFDGWSKLAIVGRDRVFLFPRNHLAAEDAVSEVAALRALDAAGVSVAPRLLGSWHEPAIYAYPFWAVERVVGENWADLEDRADAARWLTLLDSLGAAIATWHRLRPSRLPPELRRPSRVVPDHLARFLERDHLDDLARRGAGLLGGSGTDVTTWMRSLARVVEMPEVLVHGDVCENQLIVDGSARVRAVIDWAVPGIGNPVLDFNFGEWGFGIFRYEDRFAEFRRALWGSYARARGLTSPDWVDVHLWFSLADAFQLAEAERDGTLDGWGARRAASSRANLEEATRMAGER